MNVFLIEPTSVIVPVTLYVVPSLLTKPSPETTTVLFVNGLPSYCFFAVALVNVTFLGMISNV